MISDANSNTTASYCLPMAIGGKTLPTVGCRILLEHKTKNRGWRCCSVRIGNYAKLNTARNTDNLQLTITDGKSLGSVKRLISLCSLLQILLCFGSALKFLANALGRVTSFPDIEQEVFILKLGEETQALVQTHKLHLVGLLHTLLPFCFLTVLVDEILIDLLNCSGEILDTPLKLLYLAERLLIPAFLRYQLVAAGQVVYTCEHSSVVEMEPNNLVTAGGVDRHFVSHHQV